MKIKVNELWSSMLEGRIYRPHYLDPQNGIIHSSICLDRDTLKFCNASDLNPKTGTVRNATLLTEVQQNAKCSCIIPVSLKDQYNELREIPHAYFDKEE